MILSQYKFSFERVVRWLFFAEMKFKHCLSYLLLLALFVSSVKGLDEHQHEEQEPDQVPDASEEVPEQKPSEPDDPNKFFEFDSSDFVKSIFKMLDLDGKE